MIINVKRAKTNTIKFQDIFLLGHTSLMKNNPGITHHRFKLRKKIEYILIKRVYLKILDKEGQSKNCKMMEGFRRLSNNSNRILYL